LRDIEFFDVVGKMPKKARMAQLKIESARRQLGAALSLYLSDNDPVSVNCLATGGCEMIEYFAEKVGAKPFTSHILKTFPNVDIKAIRRLQRQFWTAFKHPIDLHARREREDDELLSRFDDTQNDHALFIGWYDYMAATGSLPIEAQVHQLWYLLMYPEKVDLSFSLENYEHAFPDLRKKSRTDQKRMLNDVIAQARLRPGVMDDPATDKRPLLLGWP
jgi:hypothetical protein